MDRREGRKEKREKGKQGREEEEERDVRALAEEPPVLDGLFEALWLQ